MPKYMVVGVGEHTDADDYDLLWYNVEADSPVDAAAQARVKHDARDCEEEGICYGPLKLLTVFEGHGRKVHEEV